MIYKVCSVRDAVAEDYQTLVLEDSENTAIRAFKSSVISSKAQQAGLLFTNPGDFSLWLLGEFDTSTGVYTPVVPVRLCEAGEING